MRMSRITIRLPDELDDAVEEFIGYGSKSEFYREAAEEKLARDGDYERSGSEETPAE
jgi:metal-responsive CopG/Arc/MetJ family transcriptional regulator